jgi:Putative beta-barrel porin-2, OmpL-like. bbp2
MPSSPRPLLVSAALLFLLALAGPAPADADEPAAAASPQPAALAAEPFAFADFGWLNGSSRQTEFPLDGKVFSGQFSLDTNYTYSLARPKDHTLVGSTTSGRTGELQLSDIGIGGDFHWKGARGRVMTQFGLYSTMQPRNDASPSRGQWSLADAYRYLSEAYAGYHWDVLSGVNLDAGLFMSYVGLCSYYDFENWVYQESYVSANTPWFFQGVRLQIFVSDKLKIEPWLINGWQSYGTFNEMPGAGLQILWRPTGSLSLLSNSYFGADTLGNPDRRRFHSDNSVQVKYLENPGALLDRAAFSFTFDLGCESGGGVSCFSSGSGGPAQQFIGFMVYNRLWLLHDLFGVTLGGGAISNPGRYLVLLPAINGATAASGTPYFTTNPGDSFTAWDASLTVDYMPSQFVTARAEFNHREASVPYFAGSGGITPDGGNQGPPGSKVDGFTPDLVKAENRFQLVLMVRL